MHFNFAPKSGQSVDSVRTRPAELNVLGYLEEPRSASKDGLGVLYNYLKEQERLKADLRTHHWFDAPDCTWQFAIALSDWNSLENYFYGC